MAYESYSSILSVIMAIIGIIVAIISYYYSVRSKERIEKKYNKKSNDIKKKAKKLNLEVKSISLGLGGVKIELEKKKKRGDEKAFELIDELLSKIDDVKEISEKIKTDIVVQKREFNEISQEIRKKQEYGNELTDKIMKYEEALKLKQSQLQTILDEQNNIFMDKISEINKQNRNMNILIAASSLIIGSVITIIISMLI